MLTAIDQLIADASQRTPGAVALLWRDQQLTYAELNDRIDAFAGALQALGVSPGERVAVYLPKQFETVVALFGSSRAGAVFIPVNPQLKADQVGHILHDAGASWLVTHAARARQLQPVLAGSETLQGVILTDSAQALPVPTWLWNELPYASPTAGAALGSLAALLYTSGSTGRPKGVMVSHDNLLAGAQSVAGYLENSPQDRLLAVLPLSFDYGLSQLTTAFYVGASVVLLEYLLPRDVIKAVDSYRITGLAGVPPLWQQLATQPWPETGRTLRYFTNSGGHLPEPTLARLREAQPQAQPILMYGLTEAFRSTWLPPDWLDRKPGSMGVPVPLAEVRVVHPDGTPCAPGEEGELVHLGRLVTLGYWRDPQRTAERFRPLIAEGSPSSEKAVWSGDRVFQDEDGFLYFRGRTDEQFKCSGYRISPDEIEDVLHAARLADEAVIVAAAHAQLGQAPVALLCGDPASEPALREWLRSRLPGYMQPQAWIWLDALPRNANGKYDRSLLRRRYSKVFAETDESQDAARQ